jgi:hypothetical protein
MAVEFVPVVAMGLGAQAWHRWWVGDEACLLPVSVCVLSRAPLMSFIAEDDVGNSGNRCEAVVWKWQEGAVVCTHAAIWDDGTLKQRFSGILLGNHHHHQ